MRRWLSSVLMLLLLVSGLLVSGGVRAQESTPDAGTPIAVASPEVNSAGITLYAGGLANPRGMTWSSDGTMYVALAGSGGTTESETDSPESAQYGPIFGGNTASVVSIAIRSDVITSGCPVPIAEGLPSTRGMGGHDQGPAAVAFLDEELYVLQDGGDAATQFPDFPNGVYKANADGSLVLIANTREWIDQNPVAHIPYDLGAEGETFAMIAGDSFLWVVESNSGQVLKVAPDGQITRVADLSEGHPVPTGFALAPDGGVYVGMLTPAPYTDGSSRVVKVADDGTVTEVWTGLTMITALAVGPDGELYALEMATGNDDTAPYVHPGTGRVVRQTGPDSLAEVVIGLDFPIAMAVGPDDGLYISFPAFGGDQQLGGILRVDLSRSQPMTVTPNVANLSTCDVQTPVPSTPEPTGSSEATPSADATGTVASGEATSEPVQTAAGTEESDAAIANEGGKAATGAQAVEIKNFSFIAPTLEVPTGTTVTWTNLDTVAHTATADQGDFNSANLNPGQSFSFEFKTAGSFVYNCSYHPSMQGTIVVK